MGKLLSYYYHIIIHGINESETPDDLFIKELFCITVVKTGPVMIHRLGQKKEDRSWPAHKKARITDDYTLEDREAVKRWVKISKEKTEKDHDDGPRLEAAWDAKIRYAARNDDQGKMKH